LNEIETKIIDIDVDAFRKKILKLGAKKIFDGMTRSKAFKLGDRLLRLRDFGSRVELTYKGPAIKSKYKVREEINLKLDNYDAAASILESIGFKDSVSFNKHRESYVMEIKNIEFHLDIDDFGVMPKFIEIETKTEEELRDILDYFGIGDKNLFSGSLNDLIARYGVKESDVYTDS